MIKLEKRERVKNSDISKNPDIIDGVAYGPNLENTLISAKFHNIDTAFRKSEGQLLDFELEDKKLQGILQDININPISGRITHFDIYVPALDKPVATTIPIIYFHAEELEKQGLIVNKNLTEIEIEALPKNIPEHIEVDLSSLEHAHQSLFVKDLKIPSGVKIIIPEETPVVSILQAE